MSAIDSTSCSSGAEGGKPQITHVIFDLDGLLLDTESLYTRVTQSIISRYGKTFDWSVKMKLMGRRPLEAAQVLVESLGIPLSAEEFHKELYSTLNEMFPDAQLMPGAAALMKHLHSRGVPVAVATSSHSHSFQLKISKYKDLFSCLSHAVCSDDKDLHHGKPAPDIYLLAASRFESPPKSSANVLVFEDAPNGVASAKAAGMWTVMVPDERTESERCKQADRVLKSLEDLNLGEWGLPPL